jgi:hypothetical protein
MTTKLILASLLLLILGGTHLYAQDRELVIEKILNPMPDYDPFDKSTTAAPQFFPDAVDKRTRELLIDALTNQQDRSRITCSFLRNKTASCRRNTTHPPV